MASIDVVTSVLGSQRAPAIGGGGVGGVDGGGDRGGVGTSHGGGGLTRNWGKESLCVSIFCTKIRHNLSILLLSVPTLFSE